MVTAADFDVLTINAPTHSRLDTSGQPVSYGVRDTCALTAVLPELHGDQQIA